MAKGAFMAKLLADKIKSADQSPRVKQELSEALKTAVAAMKTKNSQESEGSNGLNAGENPNGPEGNSQND